MDSNSIRNKKLAENEPHAFPQNGVTNWRHLSEGCLYTDNDYTIDRLKNGLDLKVEGFDNVKERVDCHCYWFGTIGRKQILSIKSFLITQDREKFNVVLWLDVNDGFEGYQNNTLLQSIMPYIEVRSYDPLSEVVGTAWEHNVEIADYKYSYYNLVKRADAFRFLILNRYGGVYFDLDILFLKDLSPLLNTEFCYAWELQPYANSAIFNIRKNSELSNNLLKKCLSHSAVSPWEILKYEDLSLKNLFVLPCGFFDPIWQGVKDENSPCREFSDFFRAFDNSFQNALEIHSYLDFYPGCYTFHWHNQWDAPELENSFFGIFEHEINHKLTLITQDYNQNLKL